MMHRLMALSVVAFLFLAGCGADKAVSTANGNTPTFALGEYKIILDGSIPAGQVNVKIDNQGGEKHELVIVAAADANALPKKADGSVDEDKIPAADKIGESGDIAARSATTKTFTFKPGTYVAFCNLVDDMGMGSTTMMSPSTMMTGTTMMTGGAKPPMESGPNSTMMGGPSGTSGSSPNGHVHFALGMYMTFTVK